MSSGRLSAFLHNPLLFPSAQRRNQRDAWPEAPASVADCIDLSGMLEQTEGHAPLYSVRFTYWVDGRMFTGCFKARTCHAPGDRLQVRYDPRNPERNSADPEEKLGTEVLIFAAGAVALLYFAMAWHS